MPHVCNYTPPDPKFVLALKITPQTYEDVYVHLANAKRGRTAKLENVVGSIIIVSIDGESSWSVVNEKRFDLEYEAMDSWGKTRFTMCRVKKDKKVDEEENEG